MRYLVTPPWKGFSIWGGMGGSPQKPEKTQNPPQRPKSPPPNAQNSYVFVQFWQFFSKIFRFRAIFCDFCLFAPPPWTNFWNFGKLCLCHYPHFSENWHPPPNSSFQNLAPPIYKGERKLWIQGFTLVCARNFQSSGWNIYLTRDFPFGTVLQGIWWGKFQCRTFWAQFPKTSPLIVESFDWLSVIFWIRHPVQPKDPGE